MVRRRDDGQAHPGPRTLAPLRESRAQQPTARPGPRGAGGGGGRAQAAEQRTARPQPEQMRGAEASPSSWLLASKRPASKKGAAQQRTRIDVDDDGGGDEKSRGIDGGVHDVRRRRVKRRDVKCRLGDLSLLSCTA